MAEKFDRSKFRAASVTSLQQQQEEAKAMIPQNDGNGDRIGFLTIEEGSNTFRLFPPHPDQEEWVILKCVQWLPQQVWVDDKKRKWNNPTEEQIKEKKLVQTIKNSPLFNSRVHSEHKKDIVEEYLKFYEKIVKDEFMDDKTTIDKKIAFVKHFQTGIAPKYSWITYANKHNKDKTKTFGRLELPTSLKNKLMDMCIQEEDDEPISVDPFTDPDTGKAITVTYSKEAQPADKYKAAIKLKDSPLEDEDLQTFVEQPALGELYGKKAYKRSDFEKTLEGLRIYDEQNKLGVFAHEEWLDICEQFDSLFPEEKEEKEEKSSKTTSKSETKTSTKTTKKVEKEEVEEEEEIEEEEDERSPEEIIAALPSMSRDELKAFIKKEELDIAFNSKTTEKDIVKLIKAELGFEDDEEEEEEEVEEEVKEEKPKTTVSFKDRLKGLKKN